MSKTRREPYKLPAVTAPPLNDLKVQLEAPPEATAEDLIERLHLRLRESAPQREKEAGEPIEEGDLVECDIITVAGGEVVPGSVKQAARLEMRDFLHLPGFLQEMLQMTTFSARTFELTLPDDYPLPHLAGQNASFFVEARRVFQVERPELDDTEALASAGLGNSVEDAMAILAAEIDGEQGDQLLIEATQLVLDALAQRVEATIPSAAIDEELRQTWQKTEGRVLHGRPFPPEMVAQAEEDFLRSPELRAEAEGRIKLGLALGALIEQENLKPTNETMEDLLEMASEGAEITLEELKTSLGQDPMAALEFGHCALYQRAVEFVMSRATVEVL